ncbi:hypothetical protein QRX50_22390 [Amycolatopsis carbonis]|uniref:Membrane-associated oxidoreductase n=1 Tax=Amycolatopsis carbonis TaxID=715471 RepID=A0A9Y2IQ93_9PSEU|nr:hypothetical protein [Amycolatopsis sp. 2-15]WIX83310.1 hypothetical protein QRX50_22390 [Amycolatopsis sp. 2-15]
MPSQTYRSTSVTFQDVALGNGARGSLTSVERDLVDHVERGEYLDLTDSGRVDESAIRTWGEQQTIRAWVVRDIMLGRLAADADPRGLRLRGARIAGRLDLDNITSTVALAMIDCLLEEGCSANDSHLTTVALSHCRVEHPTKVPLSLERAVATKLTLNKTTVTATSELAGIALNGAQIGEVSCAGVTLRNEFGPALNADGLVADRVVLADGFSATGFGQSGAIRLSGARITGQLECAGATLRNYVGPALAADRLQTGGSVFLCDGFSATGAGSGAVRLLGARITGQLECAGAILHNDFGPALNADRLQAEGNVILSDGFSATGAGEYGAVRLSGARIAGQLNCCGATLHNDSGPALHADMMRAEGNVILSDGFSATGAGKYGAVRLSGARITGQLNCGEATLHNDSGPALSADGVQADRGVLLYHGFSAASAGESGTVQLLGAKVGQMLCYKATLLNDSGPALDADGLHVNGNVFLRDEFSATGAGKNGAVRLSGARITGQLNCDGATLHNDSGPALNALGLQTGSDVRLIGEFSATAGGEDVVLLLNNLRVGGALYFCPTRLEHDRRAQARLSLDGLVYTGLPRGISPHSWLRLLSEATPSYSAQPYQQLATAQRAAGHDREARRVLIQQRRDQIQRGALTGRVERTWGRLTGVLLGYGYQPWRALLGLLATFILAATVAAILGGHGGLVQIRTPPSSTPVGCTLVERVGVGLDLGTPLVSTGARARCDTTSSATGEGLAVAGWVLRLLAWAFATLFIAGFTGAVRKTNQ